MKKKVIIAVLLILVFAVNAVTEIDLMAATRTSTKIYTVTVSSKPFNNQYSKKSNYNQYTKHYYMLRSYMEQMEKDGGGILVLKKGTYKITNTIYVPSNVTIKLSNGVTISKTSYTGCSLKPSTSLFQLIEPSKSNAKYTVEKYKGASSIQMIGSGTVTINLNYYRDSIAIIMGHNSNIMVSGITFKNMNSGHFIEMDASQNVTIQNNVFEYHKDSTNKNKEAINIDTPDKATGGFNNDWSSYDCTPNKDVFICDNTFSNLERAVGTHKYSENQYHTNIQIVNNTITNCDSDPIIAMNWDTPIITGNTISDIADGLESRRAVVLMGVKNPTIKENTFSQVARPIQAMPWKNTDKGSQYAITYNVISQTNLNDMLNNTLINVGENFIRINKTYNVFDSDTDKYYYSAIN